MEILQTSDIKFLKEITDLYVEAFSTGKSEQYIELDYLNKYIDLILSEGYAHLAVENNLILGAILICPLILDKDLPNEITDKYSLTNCLYIAEMMVTEKARGKGIGKNLLKEFFEKVDKVSFSDVFIRVWDENIPAISLYEKMGFSYISSIIQTKTKVDKSGTFEMNKIYLHKKLN